MVWNGLSTVLLVGLLIQMLAVQNGIGEFRLSVTLYSFNNPDHKCAACRVNNSNPQEELGCCDDFTTKGFCDSFRGCDLFVTSCVRNISTKENDLECQGNAPNIENSESNANERIFNPPKRTGTLTKSDPWNGEQIFFLLKDLDVDPTSDKLVDSFAIDLTFPPGTMTNRTTYRGYFGLATIDLSFSLFCTENFVGIDCRSCHPGFTGDSCDININECLSVDCNGRGQCVDGANNYTCVCDAGFTGADCAQLSTSQDDIEATLPFLIGIPVGTVVLSVAIFMIVSVPTCFFIKKRRQQTQNTTTREDDLQDNPTYGRSTSRASETFTPPQDRSIRIAPNIVYGLSNWSVSPYLTVGGREVSNATGQERDHQYEDVSTI